jgi:hypothetical protein
MDNNLIALGWIDNKAVNFISTSDMMKAMTISRRICNEKVELLAPQTVARYN